METTPEPRTTRDRPRGALAPSGRGDGRSTDEGQRVHAGGVAAREVFDILVRENERMLAAFLHSLVRDPTLVDDLFQEVLLVAWCKLPSFDASRPFGPWLRGIAARHVLRERERGSRGVRDLDPEVLAQLEDRHAGVPAGQEGFAHTLERLADCVDRLPGKLREAIQLFYARGLAVREVAERTSATLEACKKRLQRGRQNLRECLREGGVEP